MYSKFQQHLQQQLDSMRASGLYKHERIISSPQGTQMEVGAEYNQHSINGQVVNLCANNYLGFAQHPEVRKAAIQALDDWGYGMASVRFICGTQHIHKQLEQVLSELLGFEDSILYPSCFDANGGLFETLFDQQDALISDQLNHASIIDGIRLCRAKRYRYANNDMLDLERQLHIAHRQGVRFKLISTDGVFSMDGSIAKLKEICDLADRYDALVHVDDSHGIGCLGNEARGTLEHENVIGRVDILTGTLGKALGGASGGFTCAKSEIIEMLRQRSRPYLFSNTVPPPVVAGSLKALEILQSSNQLVEQLSKNTKYFRQSMIELDFDMLPGIHPICPVMLYDAKKAADFAERMLIKGVYLTAFSYPVVARGKARIRAQISAAHRRKDLDKAVDTFAKVRQEMT